jgi:hypothetical protein
MGLFLKSSSNGLSRTSRGHIYDAAIGVFFSLTTEVATAFIEKIISSQGLCHDRLQPRHRGTNTVKEEDILTVKMDLLMKRLDDYTIEKASMSITSHAMDSHMICEVCGSTRHSGNHCQEDVMHINGNNNGYRQQGDQTWNQQCPYYQEGNQGNSFNPNEPFFKYLVYGQAKVNVGVNKKISSYNKTLETLNIKIYGLSYAPKNYLSFNKMFET